MILFKHGATGILILAFKENAHCGSGRGIAHCTPGLGLNGHCLQVMAIAQELAHIDIQEGFHHHRHHHHGCLLSYFCSADVPPAELRFLRRLS